MTVHWSVCPDENSLIVLIMKAWNDCSTQVISDVPHDLMWVSQSFTFVCLFNIFIMCEQMTQTFSWYTVKVPSSLVVVSVCVAAEKGWIQPRIPQALELPQASFRSRISKEACVYPSLCMLFLTTQHPRPCLCLHSP